MTKSKIKILESDLQIQNKINIEISKYINSKIKKNKNRAISKLRRSVDTWIRSQPEVKSLLKERVSGELNAQFGLRPGSADSAVDQIVSSIVDSIQISVLTVDKKLRGSVEFKFQSRTFTNLLGLTSGFSITEKGQSLHWLDWLLNRGDSVIVIGYKYQPSNQGRSGGGKMVVGDSFRVPPNYSGTNDNNFITRAFSGRNTELSNIISGMLK